MGISHLAPSGLRLTASRNLNRHVSASAAIRERVRDAKRHRAEQRLYNGGKRQFGWDVVDGRLVPNAIEQAVIERMKSMRANGATYREIGGEVGMYGRTVQRILDRA